MTDPNAQPPQDPNLGQPAGPPPPPQQPQYAPPAAAQPMTQAEDIQWASFAHLGGILGFLPSLIIWLVFKDRGPFTNVEAKEALNFQLTLLGAWLILWIVTTVIGIATFGLLFFLNFLVWIPWIVGVIFSIIAYLQVKDGRGYRYPFAVRLIK
ncbi:MAG: DUF4870 domain-containing protein [Leifsonia sp.]